MDNQSDDLIFYTDEYGYDCVKGYFKVLTEPEEFGDSSWVWTTEMIVAGKEFGELKGPVQSSHG